MAATGTPGWPNQAMQQTVGHDGSLLGARDSAQEALKQIKAKKTHLSRTSGVSPLPLHLKNVLLKS